MTNTPTQSWKRTSNRCVILGVYLPGQDRKRPHLRCLIAYAEFCNANAIDALCIGDFNSGRNATDIELNLRRSRFVDEFSTADLYAEFEEHWTEAWAYKHPDEYEFSWYPFRTDPDYTSSSGWRIDKAFVSRSLLPRVQRGGIRSLLPPGPAYRPLGGNRRPGRETCCHGGVA